MLAISTVLVPLQNVPNGDSEQGYSSGSAALIVQTRKQCTKLTSFK